MAQAGIAPGAGVPRLGFWPRVVVFSIAVALVYLVAAEVGVTVWTLVRRAATPPLMALFAISTYPLMILMAWGFVGLVDRARLADIGLKKEGWWQDLARGAAIAFGFVAVMTGLYSVLGMGAFQRQALAVPGWIFHLLAVYPLIGFAEELIFRGYLFKAVEDRSGTWAAFTVTTILFWLPHIGSGQGDMRLELIGVPFYLATGSVLALCRIASKGLWLPIGFHTAFNWAAMSLMGAPKALGAPSFFLFAPTVPHWVVGPPGQAGVVDVALILVLLVGIYLFLYRRSVAGPSTSSP